MKKKTAAIALAAALSAAVSGITLAPVPARAFVESFSDVSVHDYFFEPTAWAIQFDIASGTGDNNFSPYAPCTRAQAVTFLYRDAHDFSSQKYQAPKRSSFKDVSRSSYYAIAVDWAAEQKITAGTSRTTFSPNRPCTRAQLLTMIYREKKQEGCASAPKSLSTPFTDVPKNAYYAEAVSWAVAEGVTAGTSARTFSPNAPCTRAQAITFLWRADGEDDPSLISTEPTW